MQTTNPLTAASEDAPVESFGTDRPGRWLVTCDHASNRVPPCVGGGDLGIADADMARHIAYDIGARGLALELGRLLDSPVVASRFSRLVIDPNRGEDDPTVLMKLYDGTIIPANRHADAAEKARRLAAFHRPYHAEVGRLAARRRDTAILAVHSFTPQLKGRDPRPWQVAVLHSHQDERLAQAFLRRLKAEPDLCVGDNEPYSGHLAGDSIHRHGLLPGRPSILIELRNDLIGTAEEQAAWAARLAPMLEASLAEIG